LEVLEAIPRWFSLWCPHFDWPFLITSYLQQPDSCAVSQTNARDAMGGRGKITIEAGNAGLDDNYADKRGRSHGPASISSAPMTASSSTSHDP